MLSPLFLLIALFGILNRPLWAAEFLINGHPQDATIYIDNQERGVAPLSVKNIKPGVHHLLIKKLGHLSDEQTVNVTHNQNVRIDFDLLPYAGILRATSDLDPCDIEVDGKWIGKTPFIGEIAIGKRIIEVKRKGYQSVREQMQVGAGTQYTVRAVMKPVLESVSPTPSVSTSEDRLLAEEYDEDRQEIEADRLRNAPHSARVFESPGLAAAPLLVTPEKWEKSWYEKWWVWAGIGAVVATAVVVPVAITQSGSQKQPIQFKWDLQPLLVQHGR